jgi:phosphate transport system permease protein
VSTSSTVLQPGESHEAARPVPIPWKAAGHRLLLDRFARWAVTLGGVTIIVSILAILLVIIFQIYPLFQRPTVTPLPGIQLTLATPPLALGVDEYREVAYLVASDGLLFTPLKDGTVAHKARLADLGAAKITNASQLGRGPFALGLSDGRVLPIEVTFTVSRQDGKRTIAPEVRSNGPVSVDPEGRPIRQVAYVETKAGPITVAAVEARDLVLVTVTETKPLIGTPVKEESRQRLSVPTDGEITALALDARGEELFVGTSSGQLIQFDLRDPGAPKLGRSIEATGPTRAKITTISFLSGDRTLVVGDAGGGVAAWRLIQMDGGNQPLVQIYAFAGHKGPVVAIEPSQRDKSFITVDESGMAHLHYGTSGKTLLTVQTEKPGIRTAAFAPKADGFSLLADDGRLSQWALDNRHPEITLTTLFGKVWYEGYKSPAYVWQSTGATDDFESKMSLIPLIYGTLKGTFYALLIAVPIALLAALYASQFMHPKLKGVVKPTVEIMAALPSVVLGFLAGLWLAPRLETIVPGLFLMELVIPPLILAALFAWRATPIGLRRRVLPGTELALLIPILLVGVWLSFQLGGVVERYFLAGDYRHWLLGALGLGYDQRNSLVVGIAMGFAVIPIIFTIAEDSLSNVPQHLVAGSLALGATRWQTALRVVLPTASPGIFSAIMIGFGRAVGETMIVLMATGNTPVMNWNIFSGFRALSANIAVELPEAPAGGTLFRVLFLAALLLFILTFIVNTAAELVRLRLRRKYRYL